MINHFNIYKYKTRACGMVICVVAVELHFFYNVIAFLNVTLYFGRIHWNQLQT